MGSQTPPPGDQFPGWLQLLRSLNDNFGVPMRCVGLIGFIVFASLNKIPIAMSFFGLIPSSYALGKSKPKDDE